MDESPANCLLLLDGYWFIVVIRFDYWFNKEAEEFKYILYFTRFNDHIINIVIVDGCIPIKAWEGKQLTLIKGENKCLEIAAASVIAKEARDSLIKRLSKIFQVYGINTNVGYGTSLHRQKIRELGPSTLHRLSFLTKILSSKII